MRARITDAHLLFDADVTVPVARGEVDFNRATVEHVGPDSRMGVSRMGFYVDAPNGRSYLFQFASDPAGVRFERRDGLLGALAGDRGGVALQPFVEAMLRQAVDRTLHGLTGQARALLGRTAVQGELQLGDGAVTVGGLRAVLSEGAQGHNRVRLHSEAVGRGLRAEVQALALDQVAVPLGGRHVDMAAVRGAVSLDVTLAPVAKLAVAAGRLRLDGIALRAA